MIFDIAPLYRLFALFLCILLSSCGMLPESEQDQAGEIAAVAALTAPQPVSEPEPEKQRAAGVYLMDSNDNVRYYTPDLDKKRLWDLQCELMNRDEQDDLGYPFRVEVVR